MRKKYILALTSTAILLSLSNQMKVQASNEFEDLGITHENSDGSEIGGEDPVEYPTPTGLEAISLNSVIDSAQASPESPSNTQVNKKNDSSSQAVQTNRQDWRTHSNGLIYDEDLPASPIDQQEVPLIAAEAPGDKVGIRDINFYERLCDVYNIPYEEGKTFTVRHFRRLTELSPEVCVAHNTAEKSFQVSNIAGLEFAENLQKLSLANQPIGDISYISGLTNLAYIDMRNLQDSKTGQPITDYTPFENLVNLEFLNLAQSKPVNPEKLSNLSKLKHLNLMSSKIDDLSFATDMKELEYLNIQYSNISDLSPLAQATKLETLILDRQADSLTDSEAGHSKKITDLAMLDQLTKLKEISIDNHAVKDISVVSNWKNLTSFMAQNNDIQDLSPLLSLPLITGEVWVQGNLGLSGDTTSMYRQAKKLHMALEKPVYTSEDISAIDAILNASEDVKAFFNQEILEGLQIYKGRLQDGQQVDNQLIPFTSVSASGQWIQLEHRDEVNLLIVDDNNNKVFEPLEFQIYDNGYLIKNQISEDGYLRLSASPIPYTIRAIHFNDQKVFELQTAGSHRIGTVQNHKGRIALNDQNQVDLGQYLTIQIPAETEEKMEEPKHDEKSAEVGLSGDRLTLRVLDQDGKPVTQPLVFTAGDLDVINNENGTYTFISDGSSDSHTIRLVSDDYELVGDNALKTSSKTNFITGETFASFNLIKLKGDIVDESWTKDLNLEIQVKDQPETTEDQEQDETEVEINRPQENETQAEVGLSGDRLTLRVLDQDGKLVTQPLAFTAGDLDVINNENGTYTFISDGSSDSHTIRLASDDYELVGDNALKTSSKTNFITGETFASFNLIKLKGDIVDESWTHSLNLELQVKEQPEATEDQEQDETDVEINRPQENETQAEVGLSGDRLTLRVLDQDGKLVTQPLAFTAGNLDVINNENGTYTFISDGSSDSHTIRLASDDYELVGDNALKTSSKTNFITGETFASFNLIKLKGDIVDESWTKDLNLEIQVKDQPETTEDQEQDETEVEINRPQENEAQAEVGLSGDRLTLRVLDQDGKPVTQPLDFTAGNLDVINNENGTYTFISDGSSDSHAISLVSDDYELVGDNALKTSSKTNYITGQTFASFNLIKLKGDIVDESWTHSLNLELQVKDQPEATVEHEKSDIDLPIIYMVRPSDLDLTAGQLEQTLKIFGSGLTKDLKLATYEGDQLVSDVGLVRVEGDKGGMKEVTIQVKENTDSDIKNYTTYFYYGNEINKNNPIIITVQPSPSQAIDILDFSTRQSAMKAENGSLVATLLADPIQSEHISFLVTADGQEIEQATTEWINVNEENNRAMVRFTVPDNSYPVERIYNFYVLVKGQPVDQARIEIKQNPKTVDPALLTLQVTGANYNEDRDHIHIHFDENIASHLPAHAMQKNIQYTTDRGRIDQLNFTPFSEGTTYSIDENTLTIKLNQAVPKDEVNLRVRVVAASIEGESGAFNPDVSRLVASYSSSLQAKLRTVHLSQTIFDKEGGPLSIHLIGDHLNEETAIEIFDAGSYKKNEELTSNVNYNLNEDNTLKAHVNLPANTSGQSQSYIIRPIHEGENLDLPSADEGINRVDAIVVTVLAEGQQVDEPTLSAVTLSSYGVSNPDQPTHTVTAKNQESKKTILSLYGANLDELTTKIKLVDQNGIEWPIISAGGQLSGEFPMMVLAGESKVGNGIIGNGNYQIAEVILPGNLSEDMTFTYHVAVDGENYHPTITATGVVESTKNYGKEPVVRTLTVQYQDQNGDKIAEDRTLQGYSWFPYAIEVSQFDDYEFVSSKGDLEGEFGSQDQVIVLVYEKTTLPAMEIEDIADTRPDDTPEEPSVETPEDRPSDQPSEGSDEDEDGGQVDQPQRPSETDDKVSGSKEDSEEDSPTPEIPQEGEGESNDLEGAPSEPRPETPQEDDESDDSEVTPEEPSVDTPQDRPSDQPSEGSGEDEDGGQVDQPQTPSETDDKVSGSKEDSEEDSPTPEIPQEGEGESNDLEGAPSEPRPETPQEDDESDDSEVTPEEPSVETPEDRPSDQPSEGSDEDEDGGQVDQPQRPSESDDEGSGSKEDSEEDSPTPETPQKGEGESNDLEDAPAEPRPETPQEDDESDDSEVTPEEPSVETPQEDDESDDSEVTPEEPSVDTPQDRPSDQPSEGSGEGAGDSPVDQSQPSRETGSEDGGSTAGLAENTVVWIPIPLEGNRMAYAEQVSGGQLLIKVVNDQSEIFNRAQTALNGIADFDLYDIEFVDQNNNEVDINRPIKFRLAYDPNKNVKSVVYLGDHFEVARTLEFKDNKDENYVEISHETFSYFAVVYEEIDKQLIAKAESASDDNIETAEKDLDDNQPMSSQDISKESSNPKLPQTGATHVGLLGLSVATVLSGLGLVSKKRK